MAVGVCQAAPYVVFSTRTGPTLRRLYRSNITWARAVLPNLNVLDRRPSSWFSRSPYSVPGATSCTVAVAFGPAARLRPSDCATCALALEMRLGKAGGVERVGTAMMLDEVLIDYDESKITLPALRDAIKKAGYSGYLTEVRD